MLPFSRRLLSSRRSPPFHSIVILFSVETWKEELEQLEKHTQTHTHIYSPHSLTLHSLFLPPVGPLSSLTHTSLSLYPYQSQAQSSCWCTRTRLTWVNFFIVSSHNQQSYSNYREPVFLSTSARLCPFEAIRIKKRRPFVPLDTKVFSFSDRRSMRY